MKRGSTFLLILLALSGSAQAQSVPFDMTPELPLVQPIPEPLPATSAQGQQSTTLPLTAQPPAAVPSEASGKPAAGGSLRYILPSDRMRFEGEIDQRSWVFYASEKQATSPTRLHMGYRNAIVVAPEASSVSVTINNLEVMAATIRSPDAISTLVADIPAGVLRSGENLITFRASQRHRTDCSIVSTYDLWTDIDPGSTYLEFLDQNATRLSQLEDVRAVGLDQNGTLHFRIIAPAFEQINTTAPIMRLSQALALIADAPQQSFSIAAKSEDPPAIGELSVVIGTVEELRPLLPKLPASAATDPTASFLPFPEGAATQALVITGPSWQSISALVENIVASTRTERKAALLSTSAWSGGNTPVLGSERTISFRDLRAASQEFSGRRFKTSFMIGVPSDFYADAYGEGLILLDAAYSPAIQPGSHLDIYVNGTIASTVPITSRGGALLNHLPIKLTLQHFKPGANEITIEALLITKEDAICMPGATAEPTARFALFDSSEFHIPDFARIATMPNLAATGATGFPYANSDSPTSIMLGRVDSDTVSAALTFVSKLATSAQAVLPVDVITTSVRVSSSNAIFIGTPSDLPPAVMSQLNLQGDDLATWSHKDEIRNTSDSSGVSVSDWRDRVAGGFFERQGMALRDWAQRNFNLSVAALRLKPAGDRPFMPADSASMIVAQDTSPDFTGSWIAVLSPDTGLLRAGVDALVTHTAWQNMTGRVFVYNGANNFANVPVSRFRFIETVPPSLGNWRLIATNWLSDNIMAYGALLVAGALLVGLSTAFLLSKLGRHE